MNLQLMTCSEVALYLRVPVSRIRYETFLRRIPFIKIGRSVRYSKIKIDEWIQKNERGGLND